MARLPRASYALMVSLLPAVATVVWLLVLAQVPTLGQAGGVLVAGAVAWHRSSVPASSTVGRAPQR
jgi:inner membrane transporter RhtA